MAALPIAMLGATVLGIGAGIASLYTGASERDSIQLLSGQHVRVQGRVRLSEEGKKKHPDSCLVASEDGTVTKVDVAGRKATVRCNKNRRAAPEEIAADDLEVIDSGINAPGISIPGGYLTEGASVRMLDSSKRTNRGKALASPFYNPVGTVMAINKVEKQVVVLSNHLNNKSTAQEFYNVDDLEFVSGPSADARKGAEAGLAMKIGSTVELTKEAFVKHTPTIIESNLGSKTDNKKLADPKWEKFGIVKSITVDPKDIKKRIVIVRCVSKDSKKEVLEQKYDFNDLKAIPAISVERAGIAVFGGMAEMDTKVKLRSERKSAVASKSLGRSAFGDVGTVSDLEPNDPNNLKVFVTCNGINPEEQTGDWYQPEDLELAEPEDTEGEAVFGGRVVVGSTVRVMQSARGKKCLGTPEFGDVGTVKGIDPSAADNLKINVTCGRTDAKQSEWYDPRDLSLFFPVDESGSDLEKARVVLAAAQKELSAWQLQPQTYRRSDKGRADRKALEDKVAAAQADVDRLSGQGLDKTKASEMRNDSEEKLDEAMKLKRELEAVRLKLSRDSTCKKPDRSKKYKEKTDEIVNEWLTNMNVNPFDYKIFGLEPLQYSNSYRVAGTELQTAFESWDTQGRDDTTRNAYVALNKAKLELRKDLKSDRSDTESFSNLDNRLLDVTHKQNTFNNIAANAYKSALHTVDEKLKKLQEVTTQIESAAYSGDSPAEKLLKRVEGLETKTNKDIADDATNLAKAVKTYNEKFLAEQKARTKLDTDKYVYDQEVLGKKKPNPPASITDATIEAKLDTLEKSRLAYLNAQKDTLKARKEQALLSAKTTCSEITLESVKDMKSKIEKIIGGKCDVLTTIDNLLNEVDDLISKRRRAFTMSQAVLDPKFGDPTNATFDVPITSPEDRIAEIDEAMSAIKSSEASDGDVWNKLQHLIDLCGTYPEDTFLPDAKAIKPYPQPPPNNCPRNPGPSPKSPNGLRPNKPVRLSANAPVVQVTPPTTPPGSPEESEDEASTIPPAPPATDRDQRLEWVSQHSSTAAQNSGFTIGQTPGNGDCLFGAVASALAGSNLPEAERQRQEADLRARAVAYIADPQNIQTFQGIDGLTGGITGYVQDMSQPGVYGGDPEIAALEGVLGRCINVWQPRTGGTDLEKYQRAQLNTTGCLNLFYNGINHYDPLYGSGPPSGGKRKWPFYGRRTTRRHGGGPNENRALFYANLTLTQRRQALERNPENPTLIQAVKDAEDAVNRARNTRTESITNPFYGAPPNIRPSAEEIVKQQVNEARTEEKENIELLDEVETENAADDANTDLPPPLPQASTFDSAENQRQFDEAIRATEARTRLLVEENQKEYQRQLAENQRVQDKVIANLRMNAEKGKFDARQEATRKELERKEAEIEETKKKLLQELLDKNKRVRNQAEAPLQDKVAKFKNEYLAKTLAKKKDEMFKKLDESVAEMEKENKRKADKLAAKLRKEKEEDEARLVRVKKEREAFLKTKDKKDIEAELLEQGGPELLAAWKKDQKSNAAAEAAADRKFNKDTATYNSLMAKWAEYEEKYKVWTAARKVFDECYDKYTEEKKKWLAGLEIWLTAIKKVSEAVSGYQILRLQSRGVGSSLMLDEARKLMIEADAQQLVVMDAKTDLQFTLASSSDADIAKAVGFYEAEVQKLKTCISKGKEDAIAEYDKDLAEIEKRKKEITTKTFEVKAPQENQQQGTPKYNEWDTTRLTAEVGRLNTLLATQKAAPMGSKQNKKQAGTEVQLKAARKALATKIAAPAPTPGGRRMTMRRRRV